MSTTVEQYQQTHQQLELIGNEHAWLKQLREQALQQFSQQGFPAAKDEEWKYTRTTRFTQQYFNSTKPHTKATEHDAFITQLCQQLDGYVLTFIDGQFSESASQLTGLDEQQCFVRDLSWMFANQADKVKHAFEAHSENGFAHLNSAFTDSGAYVELANECCLDKPIILLFINTTEQQANHYRNIIIGGHHAKANIIEYYYGLDQRVNFTNTISDIFLSENSKLNHIKIISEGNKTNHIGHTTAHQQKFSEFHSHSFTLSGDLIRSDTTVDFQQEQAYCKLNGLFIGEKRQHIDHHTTINHNIPHCTSQQCYKSILTDQSRGVFNGKVLVHPQAQKSSAEQINNNILLTKTAEINTKPQLEIFADDVKCAHGATIGQLDDNALFYLRSRGINQAQAYQLLLNAFADELIDSLPCTKIQHYLKDKVHQHLNQWGNDNHGG